MSARYGLTEPPSGTRTMTVRAAARLLGVDRETIEGLVYRKKIVGYHQATSKGNDVVLVDYDDLHRVAVLAGRTEREA